LQVRLVLQTRTASITDLQFSVDVSSSQQLPSYSFGNSLDTSCLSAETISQLRIVNSNGDGVAATAMRTTTTFEQPIVTATTADIETEVIQLRSALSERTLEAQRLTQELERANRIVEELRELCRDHAAAAAGIDAASTVFA
jgi:hypothetical protein